MKLYNTMSHSKEELVTLEPGKVKIYTCGLTVYSQPHIGNWTAYIYWDLLVRFLKHQGFDVERVQNITDVGHLTSDSDTGEDKMEKGARVEGVTAWEVADKYIQIAQQESDMLGLLPPDKLIRATDLIREQIDFIKELESKGFTYLIEDGVYFDTSKLSDYGKLARLDIEGLRAGERVDIGHKRNPTDFALWKLSPKDTKRDMEWESPWGVGFPGWHLECSVIARQALGDQIDIHTGGIDHIPVHHTNEIAQSESVTGKQFSRFWVHGNHIKVNGTKISKSLGNVYTLQDIQDQDIQDIENKGYTIDAFKLMVLSKHYRTEGNFTWEILDAAQNRLNNWNEAISISCSSGGDTCESVDASNKLKGKLVTKLEDDLNSPQALMVIDEWIRLYKSCIQNNCPATKISDDIRSTVKMLLGIELVECPDGTILVDYNGEKKPIIDLVNLRNTYKKNSNYEESDKIREALSSSGIEIYDGKNGTWWGPRK